eukprot:2448204-Alexandrium_andersonii.AAC.1
MSASLVGSEMCIRDRHTLAQHQLKAQCKGRVVSTSMNTKHLLRVEVEHGVCQAHVSLLRGIELSRPRCAGSPGPSGRSTGLAVGADWPLNRADLADQPE